MRSTQGKLMENEAANILMVDDQPSKLLSYEVILRDLGENSHQGQFGCGGSGILTKDGDCRTPN